MIAEGGVPPASRDPRELMAELGLPLPAESGQKLPSEILAEMRMNVSGVAYLDSSTFPWRVVGLDSVLAPADDRFMGWNSGPSPANIPLRAPPTSFQQSVRPLLRLRRVLARLRGGESA
jgi:hypothetical protein